MAREHVVELFLGSTADVPTREAARARLHWLSESTEGPRALITGDESGALAILLARAAISTLGHVADAREPTALLDDLDPKIKDRVTFTATWPQDQVDTLIALTAIHPEQLARVLKENGRAVISVPFAELPLRALADRYRDHLAPESLALRGGYTCFTGRRDPNARAAWAAFDERHPPAQLLEEGALDQQRLYEARLESLDASRRALIAGSARRGRLLERSMRAAFEQNVRLREQVERTRQSARYRLGSAFVSAAKPSVETLKLPGKILEIYRTKTGRASGEHEEDEQLEIRRRLLDERLDKFTHQARLARAPWLAVLSTGTRIDGIRANRPYALARILRERGIPVLFGYNGAITGQELPPYADPLMLELPEEFLAARLEKISSLEFREKSKLWIIAYPTAAAAKALNRFNAHGWVTIYDALDDWEEFARTGVASWFSASVEKYIVANADLTTAVSRPLAHKLSAHTDAPKILVSPNALDPTFVSPEYSPRHAPENLGKSENPKIGYFGHMTPAWFDWGAFSLIAKKRPEYRFELIGYGAPAELDVPPNIRLLGPKDRREICKIAEEWSAAIIPFKMGALSDAVDPIKIYEYLALGLPAVSFRMPQIADYPATTTVHSVEEFISALDAALASAPDRGELRAFLEENTWAKRTDGVLAAAESILAKKYFEKLLSRAGA